MTEYNDQSALTGLVNVALNRRVRSFILSGVLGFLPVGIGLAADSELYDFHIAAGPVTVQLQQLARQSDLRFSDQSDPVPNVVGTVINGQYQAEDVLHLMLKEGGMDAVKQPDGSYRLSVRSGTRGSVNAPVSVTDSFSAQDHEMVVVAQPDFGTATEDSHSYTTKVMSTATHLNLSPRETPQSVSVVTRQRMDDQGITSLKEAMRQTTGVNVLHADSDQAVFQSRGFTMDNVQEDGAGSSFQNSVSGMGAAESSGESTDLAMYDHLEILRGASGLTQGNGEPGGTVNMVRKQPTYDFRRSVSLGGGSWDNYRSEFDISGPLNNDATLRGRAVGVLQKKDSAVDYVHSDRQALYGVLAYDFNDATTLTSGVLRQRTSAVPNLYGLPLSTNYGSLDLPRSTFLGASWNKMVYERTNLFANLSHQFDNEWQLENAINFTHSTAIGHFTGIWGNGTGGVDESGDGKLNNMVQRDNRSDQWSYNATLRGPFELLGRTHQLVVGGDYQKEKYNNLFGRVLNTAVVDVFNWNPSTIAEPDWPDYSNRYRYNIYQRSLFATSRLTLSDSWKLILGSRYSAYSYDMYNTNIVKGSTSDSGYRVRDQLSPYGGLLWDFADHYTWYASYSEIYKPQNNQDQNGHLLKPVTGANYETGIKGEFLDGGLNGSIALYRIIQKNNAVEDMDCQASEYCYSASGKVRSQGVEAELSGQVADGLQLFAGYTLTNSKYLEGEEGTKGRTYSLYTPQHMVKLYTTYQLPGTLHKWTVGGGLTTQSDITTSRNARQGGYTLFDANVNYQATKNLSFNLAGYNLTDKVYYQSVSNRHRGAYNFYGDPRNFMLTAKWSF